MMGGMCEERHVLRLTFLGLPLCASGLEPVLFQAQLVEKCFALKDRKRVEFDTFIPPENSGHFGRNTE